MPGRPFARLLDLRVHHADPHLVVVEKPPGLLTHRTHPGPAICLVELLRRAWWDDDPDGITPVHRLDAGTSGLVVLARTPTSARALGRQFATGGVRKRYLAIVRGVPARDRGIIDVAIGPDPGGAPRGRQRAGGAGARPARTRYRVLARRGGHALAWLAPETGRPHQLRVHLASLGCPVAGDGVYGTPAAALPGRQALHAAALAFDHPLDGRRLRFHAGLPADLRGFWGGLPEAPARALPRAARVA